MKKNSSIGTISTKSKNKITAGKYSVEEVCAIIKQCRESGVTRLKIGTFSASFLLPEPQTLTETTPTSEQLKGAREYQNAVFLENEARIREEELANLRIEDPLAYEELIHRGELEHAGEGSEETNP